MSRAGRPRRRRPLLMSRLARLIFVSHLIGLLILILGALAMNRFQSGLVANEVNDLTVQTELMTQIMAETATGYGVAAELDLDDARDVLRRVELPPGWRVRLHDRGGSLIADSAALDGDIRVAPLAPLPDAPPPPPTRWEQLRAWATAEYGEAVRNLPWRVAERERLQRDLVADVRAALAGDVVAGPAYSGERLIVSVSAPVRRVSNVLGALTLEADDIDAVVQQEREALLPVIGIACLAALLSAFGLTYAIARPLRMLARGAELVARASDKRDVIPDLSRRRDDIGELSVRMREMSRGLYDRIDDVANFAADVAHEIKNPLTSLQSASESLRAAKTDAQRRKLLGIIQADVGRVNRLISDISAASRVDANLARERAEIVDVSQLCGGLVDFYDSTTPADAPRVRYFGPPEGEAFIKAFGTPFAQVLRNLIDNAITFSPGGAATVRLQVEAEADRVRIAVEDEGPGIPENMLETVFERFYTDRSQQQQPDDSTPGGSHSGLGLTIGRQIVAAHKGKLHAENRLGPDGEIRGARFVVDVPRVTKGGAPARPGGRRGAKLRRESGRESGA